LDYHLARLAKTPPHGPRRRHNPRSKIWVRTRGETPGLDSTNFKEPWKGDSRFEASSIAPNPQEAMNGRALPRAPLDCRFNPPFRFPQRNSREWELAIFVNFESRNPHRCSVRPKKSENLKITKTGHSKSLFPRPVLSKSRRVLSCSKLLRNWPLNLVFFALLFILAFVVPFRGNLPNCPSSLGTSSQLPSCSALICAVPRFILLPIGHWGLDH
jgi:hypothetical protein